MSCEKNTANFGLASKMPPPLKNKRLEVVISHITTLTSEGHRVISVLLSALMNDLVTNFAILFPDLSKH